MSHAEIRGSLPEQKHSLQEEGKALKREKKCIQRKLKKNAKRAGGKPEMMEKEQPETAKQDQLELPADADITMYHDSGSEWEGFPDPPDSSSHIPAVVSEVGGKCSVVFDENPAIEGKNGVGALQQSIAHQFPGNPHPATHALTDFLDGPALRGLAAPSQPDNYTVHQLALATRLWFDEYRGKQVRLGVVRKNGDPVIDLSGGRRNKILWIRSMDGNPFQPKQKPTRFCGMEIIPAVIRQYEKEYAKTNGSRH
ncbi:hypothetical protein LZ32DRAFT_675773 [Colletotrichum eremochloae]|nr:hypothetical protein LZ32DRAFT_675773 [Colletotrichum eremochloae]